MKRSSKSFEIALSAISCAIAAAALMLGSASSVLLGLGYILAVFALMVPLAKEFVRGGALAYLGAGLLALPLGMWTIVPYAVFFGLHPLVNYLQKKYVKKTPVKAVCLAVKTVWFDFAMWLSYFVLTKMAHIVFSEFVTKMIYYIIFLGGTLLFVVYDVMIFYCQKSVNYLVRRIRR